MGWEAASHVRPSDTMLRAIAIAALAASAAAFVPSALGARRRTVLLRATASEAYEAVAASQAETIASIRSAVPDLEDKPDASWTGAVAGATAAIDAFDGPGPSNVAWMSALRVEGKLASLTAINGPLSDVPHLSSRCVIGDDGMSLFLDWRAREYGAYEMVQEDGSYPGPDKLGRDAFTYGSARKNMEEKFYTAELAATMAATRAALEGGTDGAPVNDEDAKTRGPLALDVRGIPITDANVAIVVGAMATAAEAWLGWQQDETHVHPAGARVNGQYVFDTPAKQNMYGALLETYRGLYGDDGVAMAAADSGPLDEGYVGGGS